MEYSLNGIATFMVLLLAVYAGGHQNIPPGVSPHHYQQQVHHVPVQNQQVPVQHQVPIQHQVPMQQVPVQQQGIPMQQQGVPMQQQGVPMQQQGVPMQQQGVPMQQQQHIPQPQHGHHHDGPPQVLNVANIAQEKQHIQEHLSVPIDTSKMTEQELQFHYFKMHDADNNNKLDGCELIKSLIHWHETDSPIIQTDDQLEKLVDEVLADIDSNNDGYITYPEYLSIK
uniref:EF-hand domain-containing protein n=1 Tax=Riptortus pedestris TaxID=329032 RepID=R4WIH3_RIPPE|nr:hypothetical protein [Riptortus pedestris]